MPPQNLTPTRRGGAAPQNASTMSGNANGGHMDAWSTQGLLNDPFINPGGDVPQERQQYPPQQQQYQRPKRPRSTSPAAPSSKRSKPSHNTSDSSVLAAQLKDPKTRNQALQTLLKYSNSPDLNYSLGETHGNDVLQALVDIIHKECLDYETHLKNAPSKEHDMPVLSAEDTWKEPPTKERQAWIQHVQKQLETPHFNPKLLQTILITLRNLSFVSANIRLMRNNDDIWSVLIGCLYEQHAEYSEESGGSVSYNLALHALFTLLNMAQQPQLDVTGQLKVCDALFLENSPLPQLGWGGMQLAKRFDFREDTVDIPSSMVLEISASHLIQIWSLFSALRHVLTNPTSPRSLLMVALDLLKECLDQVGGVVAIDAKEDIPSMASILRELPEDIIQKCMDCLWIPRLGPDALDYVNPLTNMVARVSALKLRMGYDANVDTDLRDRALDVLVPWLSLDERILAEKLGRTSDGRIQTRLYDALVPILTTRVGRNDAPVLATQLLKYMASTSENEEGLLYIQDRMLELASRDARVAQLAFTHLYRKKENDGGSDGAESEEEVEGVL